MKSFNNTVNLTIKLQNCIKLWLFPNLFISVVSLNYASLKNAMQYPGDLRDPTHISQVEDAWFLTLDLSVMRPFSPLSSEDLDTERYTWPGWREGGGIRDITPLSFLQMQFCLAFNCLPLKNKLCSPEMNANLLAHREKATKSQISAHHNELK